MPKVAVAIPTYNRPEYLSLAVKSILNQTFKDLEVFIFDDTSDFSIDEFLKKLNDPRVKFLRSSERLVCWPNLALNILAGNICGLEGFGIS